MFNLGRLNPAQIDEIADHASRCGHCEASLNALDRESDEVLDAIRLSSLAPVWSRPDLSVRIEAAVNEIVRRHGNGSDAA